MLMEIIEKKGEPVKTRYKFSKKEWNALAEKMRINISATHGIHTTARTVWFDVEGDKINGR